ncbi:hypothetical protein [Streptomyces sp. NPDC048565]
MKDTALADPWQHLFMQRAFAMARRGVGAEVAVAIDTNGIHRSSRPWING